MASPSELISSQTALIQNDNKYINELETIKLLNTPNEVNNRLKIMTDNWLETQSVFNHHNNIAAGINSTRLRELGNKIYTAKGKERDLLNASNFYTKAIYAACTNYEALTLAYANRGMALQAYGYIQQAYDDFQLAIEYGYPKNMIQKLIARQANCALKLKDEAKLDYHIKSLEELKLNRHFLAELLELKKQLINLRDAQVQQIEAKATVKNIIPPHKNKQKIITTETCKQRCMVATVPIAEHEIIFTERAASFVPVTGQIICQNCSITQIIPIPCPHCHGQVVYCSFKCRQSHAEIHSYECFAYSCLWLQKAGISHLAMRMVLDGLPQILSYLRDISTANELWSALIDSNGVISKNVSENDYKLTLSMLHHLDKFSNADILVFALSAQLLASYLRYYTPFFTNFMMTQKASLDEWHVVIAALIFRGIGQLIVNGHSSFNITSSQHCHEAGFILLDSKMWVAPQHIKLGQLHNFSDYREVAACNFPFLSICNHNCEVVFQHRYNGCYVTTFATKHINVGSEITNCYTLTYSKSKTSNRRRQLRETYHFDCMCERCTSKNHDAVYETFHRYRCENSNCKQVFVPNLPSHKNLNWWADGLQPQDILRCTVCNELQSCRWYSEISIQLHEAHVPRVRANLLMNYHNLENVLLNYHELKLSLGYQIVMECFAVHEAGAQLLDSEFNQLANIMVFYLNGVALQNCCKTIEYVTGATYLWDLIALGKYKCSRQEINLMLNSLNIIADEYKIIFMNYYYDFMEYLII